MANKHPIIASVPDDDPVFLKILVSLKKPVLSLSEVISNGPHGRTLTYQHIASGLLETFVSNGRRFATGSDYARYVAALRLIGEAENNKHHLAKPENRPAHDPNHQRAA